MSVLVQELEFDDIAATSIIHAVDPSAHYEADTLVYYPYYFLEYEIKARGLLPIQGKVACIIDAVSGVGALADQFPVLKQIDTLNETLIPTKISKEEAFRIATKYVQHSSIKLKILTAPHFSLLRSEAFYRPYWILHEKKHKDGYPPIMVDAITGKFHTLHI
ncbi:hypothetical protein [Parageobacillus toebii]|uniref:Uncharacterized protein n=1 Tax=Parageobacillus toebii TaxID=153151 RepID=A0A150M9J1_9BACL|nr:hypothetical protein [Parageobacillus toebii]KYD21263.1 hypothetical protein B4110_1433 [Parageobacillus toebii]